MGIVRNDRRPAVIDGFKEIRADLHEALIRIDAAQAKLDETEVSLGLAQEAEQGERPQYIVMHFGKGDSVGHTLDECEGRGCVTRAADDIIAGLSNEAGDVQSDDGAGDGPEAQGNEKDE